MIFQEKTCYTDKQLLAIFHAEDSDIPAEKFNLMCPALIQQKLAGVCKQSNSNVKDHGMQPSTEESKSIWLITKLSKMTTKLFYRFFHFIFSY